MQGMETIMGGFSRKNELKLIVYYILLFIPFYMVEIKTEGSAYLLVAFIAKYITPQKNKQIFIVFLFILSASFLYLYTGDSKSISVFPLTVMYVLVYLMPYRKDK